MKIPPFFTSKEEKWAYMQKKGKIHAFIYQPLILAVLVFVVLFAIRFILSLFEQGFNQTVDTITDNYPKKYYPIVIVFLIFWLVASVTNIIIWTTYKRRK